MTSQLVGQYLTKLGAIRQRNLASSQNTISEIFFFKNLAENEAERLVSGLFLAFKKALC